MRSHSKFAQNKFKILNNNDYLIFYTKKHYFNILFSRILKSYIEFFQREKKILKRKSVCELRMLSSLYINKKFVVFISPQEKLP